MSKLNHSTLLSNFNIHQLKLLKHQHLICITCKTNESTKLNVSNIKTLFDHVIYFSEGFKKVQKNGR